MVSVYTVLYALLLFSELSSHLVAVAMPAYKVEDGVNEQDGLGLMAGDEPMTEPVVVPAMVPPPVYRRNHVLDNNVRDEDGSPKIYILSDVRLKGHSSRGLNPAFARSIPVLTDRSLSDAPAENSLRIDRRNTDLDMLRCMIGRVYRPCWEV
ncbi:pro-MCH [Sparus aurata]|uniref:Pro-melanin-concentrating hormone n=1 Tax=Sparus aurata TaxID=8175 RepID=A0A671WDE6_SPAAU|nr:pro-MCH [Sparus aurata]